METGANTDNREPRKKFRNDNQSNGLRELIEKLPDDITGIEVGSAYGESADIFIKSGKFTELHCIDTWADEMAEREQFFDNRFNDEPRVIKHKLGSQKLVNILPDVDFVYIDACHDYESVLMDIMNYKPKAKSFIGGHDYSWRFQGVIQAVYEYFDRPTWVFRDSSWLVML